MGDNRQLIPVLLYHRIIPNETAGLTNRRKDRMEDVTEGEFEAHLKWFKASGFKSILLTDFIGHTKGHKELTEKSFIITFDDGNDSDYTIATPMMLEYGFQGNFFIVPTQIGTSGFLTWDNIFQMKNLGMSIQSHTLTHSFLTELQEKELKKEIFESKKQLEQRLGSPVEILSIPGGFYNKKVKKLCKHAGYKAICTSKFGLNTFNPNCYEINRITMREGRSPLEISKLLNPYSFNSMRIRWEIAGLQVAKYLLGASKYQRIRSFLLRLG